MVNERSLILIKHDAISRSLIGKIITRFEDAGLKIIAIKMVHADEEIGKQHYFLSEEWVKNVFEKTKKTHEKEGKTFPYSDHMEFGKQIQKWNLNFLKEGPIIAMVLEGPHAIEIIRKIVGHTEPKQALPGTIRGDFATIESYAIANSKSRAIRNLIHASDSIENAKREISIWFDPEEIYSYPKELDKYT